MQLGVCVRMTAMDDIAEKIHQASEHFTSCQLVSWTPAIWTSENAKILRELLDFYHLHVSAFWCGWSGPAVWDFYHGPQTLGLLPEEYREQRIQNLCDGADFAKIMGVNDVITHIGFIPENPHDTQFLPMCEAVRTVATHLKKQGQNLLFETGQETPVAMLRCFETVDLDNLFVNLDTANLILYGKANPVDALDVLGRYVRNIHAKDGLYPTNAHGLGTETRLGDGKVDFHALFTKLKALDYDRYVTIEREIDGDRQREDVLWAKSYLQTVIETVYGEGSVC